MYDFDKKITVGKFEVHVDTKAQYGSFEHEDYGEDYGGGLWFSDNELVDFDGVSILPKDVGEAIKQLGLKIDIPSFCE